MNDRIAKILTVLVGGENASHVMLCRMRGFSFFVVAVTIALLSLVASGQEHHSKSFALGDLAYLEQPEGCGWLCFDRQVSAERDGKRCYLQLERVGAFKVAALSKANVGDVAAYYTITVTNGKPPNPQPIPPDPNPHPPAPSGWPAQVKELTSKLPADAQGIAPHVAQAFEHVAARCGQDLFTGPEIRAALDAALRPLAGYSTRWNGWSADVTMANAKWANEAYRDAAAYKKRMEDTAAGIRAAIPATSSPPITLADPIDGVKMALDPRRHQIRGNRLFEYRCPQNGRKCSWVEIGQVLERGTGWVIVQ